MDERLQKALEFSNYTLTLNNQKKNIKNRVAQLQTVHYKDGVFKADPTTIAFVDAMIRMNEADPSKGKLSETIIVDTNENPIMISNLSDFMEKLMTAYNSAMLEYDTEYQKLKKARNIKKLMDW